MTVKDSLTCNDPDIDANIEPLYRIVLSNNLVAKPPQKYIDRDCLLTAEVEIRGNMTRGRTRVWSGVTGLVRRTPNASSLPAISVTGQWRKTDIVSAADDAP